MKIFAKFSRIAFTIAVIAILAACSSTKSSGSGEGELSESDLAAQREARFGEGGIPISEEEGFFRDVRFDYDSSILSDSARQDVEYNYQVIIANPEIRVVLEGHADERGTAEYNLALGSKRARSVRDVLVSLGVADSKIDSISYGEELPLDPGHTDTAWAKNRRVHFSATK